MQTVESALISVRKKVVEFVVANVSSADIIVRMSTKCIICSSLKAATSLSSLLLRRLAR